MTDARMRALIDRLGGLAYGGDYNPEQWDPAVWREDVRLMREAGVNLVSLGVFAWASLEPEPGKYEFGWLDEIMDLLHGNGIAVNLATPTAAPPAWLSQRYPEVLPVMADGERFGFGNRLHVEAPGVPRTWMNPSRILDFKRFTSDTLLKCFVAERDIVRSFRDDIPVVTNFMRFYRHADYWRWAPEEDAAALDIYPDPADPDAHVSAAFQFDLFRSLKGGQPWLLMEQAASAVSQWRLNVVKEPGRMRLGSLQAVSRGADSVMFFQWRAGRGGHERFHSAMLPHSGPDSRTFREVAELGREVGRLSPVAGTTTRAGVAVLFDWDGWWGLEELWGLPRNDFSYVDTVMRHYRPLWEHHYAVDVVSPHSDLSRYKVLVVPNAYLMDDEGVGAVTEFDRRGGTVVMSFFSGVVDACNRVRPDGYPGAFRRLIGAKIDEYWPARAGERFAVEFSDGSTATADWWREDIHLETGTALATYADGLLRGRAAVVANAYGAGRVVYFATLLEAGAFERVLIGELRVAGVADRFHGLPAHLECTVREDERHEYLFLLNHDPGTPSPSPWKAWVRTSSPAGRRQGRSPFRPSGRRSCGGCGRRDRGPAPGGAVLSRTTSSLARSILLVAGSTPRARSSSMWAATVAMSHSGWPTVVRAGSTQPATGTLS